MGRIHSTASISFTDGFNQIVPKVLALAQGKSLLAKQYLEAREEALTEDLPGTYKKLIRVYSHFDKRMHGKISRQQFKVHSEMRF